MLWLSTIQWYQSMVEDICRTVLDIRQFAIYKFLQFMKILEYLYILQFLTFKSQNGIR